MCFINASRISFSIVLQQADVSHRSNIYRADLDPLLKIGVTLPSFHAAGSLPALKRFLENLKLGECELLSTFLHIYMGEFCLGLEICKGVTKKVG